MLGSHKLMPAQKGACRISQDIPGQVRGREPVGSESRETNPLDLIRLGMEPVLIQHFLKIGSPAFVALMRPMAPVTSVRLCSTAPVSGVKEGDEC